MPQVEVLKVGVLDIRSKLCPSRRSWELLSYLPIVCHCPKVGVSGKSVSLAYTFQHRSCEYFLICLICGSCLVSSGFLSEVIAPSVAADSLCQWEEVNS